MKRTTWVLAGLVGLVLLSGCASLSIHSTVEADGTIEEYRIQINTTSTVYGFMDQQAEEDGYDSLRESFTSQINESRVGNISYDEEFNGDEVTITITAHEFRPGPNSSLSISRDDGTLRYEDLTWVNETVQTGPSSNMTERVMSGFVIHYYLEMPGEITDTNAHEVDGNTAEWHESGSDALYDNRIYAKSEVPTSAFGPGFGVVAAMLALLIVGSLISTKS